MTAKDFDVAMGALLRAGWHCDSVNYPRSLTAGLDVDSRVDWRACFTRPNLDKPYPDRFALNQDSIGSRAFQHAIGL